MRSTTLGQSYRDAWGRLRTRTWTPRLGIASIAALAAVAVLARPVLADCVDKYTGNLYCTSYTGCNGADQFTNYFAQVETQSGPCTWESLGGGHYDGTCPWVYVTQGGKGNLTTGGSPIVYGTHDHVDEWIMSVENFNDCAGYQAGNEPGCWVQVGWELGYSSLYFRCNPGGSVTASVPSLYVEMYDDSSMPCLTGNWGAVPSNASYDERYTTRLSDGNYRYDVYYETPGSGNIQNLAWGEYHDLNTIQTAAAEAHPDYTNSPTYCPVVGQAPKNLWNVDGQPASQSTFASYMNVYKGGWQNWTTSAAQTQAFLWPPDGQDANGHGRSTNPYVIVGISNFSAGNFTEWETTGPLGP